MRWHIKVLRGCNVCANSFIALRAPRRAPRFLPREILTFPRRLSAPLLHHGPPPATPRPMTYHPRDNATAHGPRDNVPPPATMPRDNVPPPATQLPRRSPDNVAGAPEPSSRRPHTPVPSPAHTATQLRTRPPTQPSAVTHDQRSPAPPARGTNAATPPATQHHTTSHGRPSKASGRHTAAPRHTSAATRGAEQSTIAPRAQPAHLGYTTTPRTSSMTRRNPTRV